MIITESETMPVQEYHKWYTRPIALYSNGLIIEDFVANDMSIKEIANKHKVSQGTVQRCISYYFKKPEHSLTLLSRV